MGRCVRTWWVDTVLVVDFVRVCPAHRPRVRGVPRLLGDSAIDDAGERRCGQAPEGDHLVRRGPRRSTTRVPRPAPAGCSRRGAVFGNCYGHQVLVRELAARNRADRRGRVGGTPVAKKKKRHAGGGRLLAGRPELSRVDVARRPPRPSRRRFVVTAQTEAKPAPRSRTQSAACTACSYTPR